MVHGTRIGPRPRRPWPATARTAAAIAAATAIAALAACGSNSPSSGGQTNSSPAQARQDVLDFARCMRSHGVTSFPDDLNFQNIPGLDPSSPAFKTAETACQHLLPVKTIPAAAPSARTHASWSGSRTACAHMGTRACPTRSPTRRRRTRRSTARSTATATTWIGIPISIDAHGAAFVRTATACGATGVRR